LYAASKLSGIVRSGVVVERKERSMTKNGVRVLYGLAIVVAGVAISGSAHAQALNTFLRWRNASTAHGTFYLGVSGGVKCNPANEQCGVAAGTPLITWQKAGLDQEVQLILPGGGYVSLQDYYSDPWTNSGTCLHVRGQSTSLNAVLETQSGGSCLFGDNSTRWHTVRAEDLNAPFPGCYVFQNAASSLYMAVSAGNVQNGSAIVQYALCQPGSNACGAPAGYHADQFWCPEAP
jgi:Ricin-type beta-trefoil lectin domain-like